MEKPGSSAAGAEGPTDKAARPRKIANTVPKSLTKLIKLLVKALHEPEEVVLVNVLLQWRCVSKEDLQALTLFSAKTLEANLNTLKTHRWVCTRQVHASQTDGRSARIHCYYINYRGIVNIIKYKLYKMQTKIDKDCRDTANRADYTCKTCKKTFTELDMDRLQNINIYGELQLLCTFCRSELKEAERNTENDTRELQKRFNKNMEKLRTLIEEVEDVELSPTILDPQKPNIIPHLKGQDIEDSKQELLRLKALGRTDSPFLQAQDPGLSRDEASLNWQAQQDLMKYDTNTTVEILSKADQRRRYLAANQVAKEVPTWMRMSTVAGGHGDADLTRNDESRQINTWDDWYEEDENEFFEEEDESAKKPKQGQGRWATKRNDEVIKMLCRFEKKKDESSDDESSDDEMEPEAAQIIRKFRYPQKMFGDYTYEQLLLMPVLVNNLTEEELEDYKWYARHKHNVSFMF